MLVHDPYGYGDAEPRPELLNRLCIYLRIEQQRTLELTLSDVVRRAMNEPEFALDVLDALLGAGEIPADQLETLLDTGGSTMRVSLDGKSLESRVSDPAMTAFAEAVGPADAASEDLADAWHAAHGREPDAAHACAMATRAVEAILKPVVSPTDKVATFGKMRKAIADKPSNFFFLLDDDAAAFLPYLDLTKYRGGRHGGDAKAPPTLEEARAIVHGAVTVVEWIRTGVFRRAT